MSAIVKLAARLPGDDEANGIDHIAQSLIEDPTRLRVAVVWFDTLKITHNVELDTDIPTIQVVRAEYIGDAVEAAQEIKDAALRAAQARLGHEPLPFDEVDPDAVEVYASGPDNDDARERVR